MSSNKAQLGLLQGIQRNNADAVATALQEGADPLHNYNGATVIHLSVSQSSTDADVLRLLLITTGQNCLESVDASGLTPLERICVKFYTNSEAAKLLLIAGAKVTARCVHSLLQKEQREKAMECLRLLVLADSTCVELCEDEQQRQSALHAAVVFEVPEAIQLFLAANPDSIHLVNSQGSTALDLARGNPTLETLFHGGANAAESQQQGNSELSGAVDELVSLLTSGGGDMQFKDLFGLMFPDQSYDETIGAELSKLLASDPRVTIRGDRLLLTELVNESIRDADTSLISAIHELKTQLVVSMNKLQEDLSEKSIKQEQDYVQSTIQLGQALHSHFSEQIHATLQHDVEQLVLPSLQHTIGDMVRDTIQTTIRDSLQQIVAGVNTGVTKFAQGSKP